jgi:NADPH-dependent glutamate synthase beta subunit-like oxidoreductase
MLIDAPINIRAIKRTAVDEAPADSVAVPPRGVETGKRIAVIGGGASGLTCAYFSALMGHSVVVFEQNKQLGGMLRYGIPAYRFPRERLDEDIDGILKAGDITVLKDHIVRTASMREIVQTFDAVYVSIGAQGGKMMALDHADAEGVMSAVDLLHGVGDGEVPDFTGKKVAVVGGGNVAIDCARTAVRANAAEVNIVYRRRREDMPALDHEIESAVAEGVELITLEAPLGVETDAENRCTALLTQPQMIGLVKAGRPAPVPADKPERRIEADIILVAIGQQVQTKPFEDFGLKSNWGRFVTADDLSVAECEGVFVGGDCQTGPSTVIRAVAAGKVAARNIDEYLGYHHKLECPIEVPAPKANDRTPRGRVEMIERPARVRKYDYEGVEVAMSREEAQQECGRCLRCDAFGCGVLEGGRDQYV